MKPFAEIYSDEYFHPVVDLRNVPLPLPLPLLTAAARINITLPGDSGRCESLPVW